MRTDENPSPTLVQRVLKVAIAIAGIVTIVASTGGGLTGGPECSFFSNTCNLGGGGGGGIGGGGGPTPTVTLSPTITIVQVGMPATFTADLRGMAPSESTYRWCRVPPGAANCVDFPEASGPTYTIPAASLGDDGVRFQVTVTGPYGTAISEYARLAVSPMPAVVFQDGEFLESAWVASAITNPQLNAPTFSVSRIATGGHPGAYRDVAYDMPTAPSSIRVFHASLSSTYYPTSLGAIYLIDFSQDYFRNESGASLNPPTRLLIEQGGRRFAARNTVSIGFAAMWWHMGQVGLSREDFELMDGPACDPGETCPDFSAVAEPVRFGWVSLNDRETNKAWTKSVGFDNWRVSVWRR